MYKFKFYGSDIHIPGSEEHFLLSAVINMGANQSWTVTAKISDQHPNFLKLKTLKYGLEVYKNDRLISRCRLIQLDRSFNNTYQIYAEDKLAALNDSQCRPYKFAGNPEDLFDWFIENHNAQVGEEQKLKKGNITVTDPNDYIARSWEQTADTWSLMNSRLVEPLGGFLVVRYEEDGDYLDWLTEFTLYSEQGIKFGENLLDFKDVIDATNTYTACIPYGAEIEDSEVQGQRVTVESVNDGKDYIVNERMAAEYGIIYAPTNLVTWDDVTRPENLLKKATDWLNNEGVMLLETMEFTAADLAVSGLDINSFEMYQNVPVESVPHNIDVAYLITGMKIAADLSEVLKITVGDTRRTLSTQLVKNTGEGSIKTVQGKPGTNGKSAYEIWLEAGNEGTEEDYLASLKGDSGKDGEDAVLLYIDSSKGNVFKNNQIETTLTVMLFKGAKQITDIDMLHEEFGQTAYLEWWWMHLGDDRHGRILSTDSRLGNNGFTFNLTSDDVDTKVDFKCKLITD